MKEKRLREKFEDFASATARLREVVDIAVTNDYIYDAAIQRFEFTY